VRALTEVEAPAAVGHLVGDQPREGPVDGGLGVAAAPVDEGQLAGVVAAAVAAADPVDLALGMPRPLPLAV
jgi:hypothetical protein